ncbi:MAG: glycine cleavage system protein H [Desulfovibrio sp.]|jgi:uncharacterized protein YbaR (Trm112 family)|nr:glycine cleavage system protein H [Desulfovibrio sp.]
MPVNAEELLKILACPTCLGDLTLLNRNGDEGFACGACRVVYPIRNDIPVMLKEEAIPRADWDATGQSAAS